MKNLFKVGRVFLTFFSFAIVFATFACRQTPEQPAKKMVNITIQTDSNVESVKPKSFKLEKNTMLGRSDILAKLQLTFKAGFECGKIHLQNEAGYVILERPKYKFDEDMTLFIASQVKSATPILTSLVIDGRQITIADSINAGTTAKEKVSVDVTCSPNDATIEFTALDSQKNWVLQKGENSLIIKVKKGSLEKTYSVKIVRDENAQSGISLIELSIGRYKKEGNQIKEKMGFAVPFDSNKLEFPVVAKANVEGADITYEPPLQDGKIVFANNNPPTDDNFIKNITITVKKNGEISTYEVRVAKITQALIYAGTHDGIDSITESDQNRILAGEKNLNFTVYEPVQLQFASNISKYKSCKINGQEMNTNVYPENFISSVVHAVTLNKGEAKDIHIEIEAVAIKYDFNSPEGYVEEPEFTFEEDFSFKVTRSTEAAEIPVQNLYVTGKDILYQNPQMLAKISGNNRGDVETGEPATIKVISYKEIESAKINGSVANVEMKQANGVNFWEVVQTNITGFTSTPKDVDIELTPKDKENYKVTVLHLRLNYKTPPKIELRYYEINNTIMYSLPESFKQGLFDGSKPTLNVEGSAVNLKFAAGAKLEKVKVNDQDVPMENMKEVTIYGGAKIWSFNHSVLLTGTNPTEIKIELIPFEKGLYSTNTVIFKVVGTTESEKINPKFVEISGHTNIPASFIKKLTEAQTPDFLVKDTKAKLVIQMKGYEGEFLCDKVTINGENVEKKMIGQDQFYYPTFQMEKEIEGLDATGKDITIVFKGKTGISQDLTWKFCLKTGGEAPRLPRGEVERFLINNYGDKQGSSAYYLFPNEFSEGLIDDDVKPLFEFYGSKANIGIETFNQANRIKNVSFAIDSGAKTTVGLKDKNGIMVAEHEFILNDRNEHEVEVVVYPTNEVSANYSPLKYTFKIKSISDKLSPDYVFAIDTKVISNGHKESFKKEIVSLLVQHDGKDEVMEKVEIGEENGTLEDCKIIRYENQTFTYYAASKDVILDKTEKVYVIKVTPKDKVKYATIACKLHLKGIKIDDGNAEFSLNDKHKPQVASLLTWKNEALKSRYYNDYGVEKIKLVAKTKSPRSSVKYQFVDAVTNAPIDGTTHDMTSDNKGNHTSEEITLYTDKCTKVKAWVVSKNNTTDDVNGVWYREFNEVPTFWGAGTELTQEDLTNNKVYDKIEVNKTDVKAGKIHLALIVWNENEGHAVLSDGLGEGCTPFKKIGKLPNNKQEIWSGAVDVSQMNIGDSKDIYIKITKKDILCINHKISIKIK